ncbi:hypothetical protein T12_7259 [Trichinella patagoniensis]|uniref:Uncharacterized protein n=1 Tax=Trichinella patagoniensis TaxID=990121 RepID=A0A0V1AD96_9BILA|nr:hypothetical protein T12_7259 [Trichinella patagoniensis]
MHGKQVGRSPENSTDSVYCLRTIRGKNLFIGKKKGGTQKFTGSGTSSATALKNCSIVRVPPSYSAVSHVSMRCCSQNSIHFEVGGDFYLHTSNYSYFDYLKPNANCKQGEKMNQSEFKHREEKSGKMLQGVISENCLKNLECCGNICSQMALMLTLRVSSQFH